MKRKIIKIDENKCNGCAACIPNCPEGALRIIDGKARLVSDLFCDGLGACIGHCSQGAISIEEREAEKYDEKKVMSNIVKQGENTIKAHLEHLKEHNEEGYLKEALEYLKANNIKIDFQAQKPAFACASGGCPGSKVMDFASKQQETNKAPSTSSDSALRQWPVQINLIPPFAPFLDNSHILIAADCVPFTYADFHNDLLQGKIVLVGCPKLDDVSAYVEKFKQIFANNDIKSVTYAHMEVPCCLGLQGPIQIAIKESGKEIPFKDITISVRGEKINEQ